MSTLTATAAHAAHPSTDAGYAWYLENRAEIIEIHETETLLRTLEEVEASEQLPSGTALRFISIHNDASLVPEHEEERYATTWDAYHQALDSDPHLATIAHAYGQIADMPLYQRIDATGRLIF